MWNCGVMNTPDQDTLIRAVEDARRILGDYLEIGPRDATRTLEHLLAVLDKNDVVYALYRLKRRRVIRLVESNPVQE
jgi:phage gp36-like protein